jgi:hypothetical protein
MKGPIPPSLAGASLLAFCAAAALGACHESVALHAAERGDLATLRAQIDAGEHAATLSLAETAEISRAIAFREVTQANRDDAVARVRDVRGCAPELDDALAHVMKTMDAAGAEAAMARLDAGELSEGDARSFATSANDAWRAVGVRGLTREKDAEARRKALVDPSPAVRRAAVRAMQKAKDEGDLPVAFEAARLDPEPMVRTDAVRLMGLLGRAGADVARKLSDLYPTADDAIREDIGAAWAAPGVFEHGGRAALRILLASEEGPGAISAAAAVLRESPKDPEIVKAARTELVRVMGSGPRRNRLHALAVVPLSGPAPGSGTEIVEALEQASRDEDQDIVLSALARLVSSGVAAKDHASAVERLEAFAGKKDDPRLASRARQVLAGAGDVRVQAWIEEDLHAEDGAVRLSAVGALVSLSRGSRAAPVLADPDVSVRTRGACALLVAARLGAGHP